MGGPLASYGNKDILGQSYGNKGEKNPPQAENVEILSGGAVDSIQNILFLVLFFELRNTFSTKEIMLSSVKNLKIFRLRRALLPLDAAGHSCGTPCQIPVSTHYNVMA